MRMCICEQFTDRKYVFSLQKTDVAVVDVILYGHGLFYSNIDGISHYDVDDLVNNV